mmetsp:Transcript_91671/g.163159  ORF Transcript_91671/g.163159 Transcript_91671/m.163159 type:complete len:111 (+) Transcript_91671:76-408(+)|eukprot:CAMPEP_0197655820 /NCGR_PEP_ID=MMETSP1338-20131121/39691_1 /TAXON_ID=43686 ORGANISM="Pelagodinium beii, Strain RCC1491" /NCGR_SAMPLE_ID=MMETSP1338 /ASSEMBLY_ACC=CAM_ASM_000754 /LENGTH=110 /DNA_ID=CAMNT_0043231547 /DNA_START=60 /DNA_END=392 /DNA_ORIENTATION=-
MDGHHIGSHGRMQLVQHPELQYGHGVSGQINFDLKDHAAVGRGATVQHHELQYGAGISGCMAVDHTPSAGHAQDVSKAAPVTKRVPGRGQVVSVDERITNGWQRRRDRTR